MASGEAALAADLITAFPGRTTAAFLTNFARFLAALAAETEDAGPWYGTHPKCRAPFYTPHGLNSGVMLLDLARCRSIGWSSRLASYHARYGGLVKWGDQDLLNVLFHFERELLLRLPCHWNYRPDHCMEWEPKREREIVGDWLLGPQQMVTERLAPDGQYTLEQAHAGYTTLLSELDELSGAVARAAEGKHYALVNNGAATFEAWPFYGDHSRVWDSLFFNNYGVRSVHEDAGLVSYNWGAPFYLCFNTLHINGKTCTCMASGVLGLDKLRAVRDEARRLLLQLVDDEKQPLEPTKGDSKSKSKSKVGLFSPKSKSKSKKSLV